MKLRVLSFCAFVGGGDKIAFNQVCVESAFSVAQSIGRLTSVRDYYASVCGSLLDVPAWIVECALIVVQQTNRSFILTFEVFFKSSVKVVLCSYGYIHRHQKPGLERTPGSTYLR